MTNELTNPNNVVTEERLAQFYQQILPYMGGMPDILANKFSKSDLYSTDEKLIGRWIDGKPLYQLTFKVTNFSSSSRIYKDILDATDLNVEHLIFGYGWCSGSGDVENTLYRVIPSGDTRTAFAVCYRKNTKKIQAILDGSMESPSDCYGYVTIKYTKTTDSAVEIGDDTDYSTTEKIVGTWIDGKPLYQKTLNCGALPNNTTKNVAHGISDLAYVVSCDGFALNPTSNIQWPLPFISTGSSKGIGVSVSATNVELSTDYDRSGYTYTYITIRYTKTS